MTAWRLVLQGLRHYRRTHLGVWLGVVCATAVLVGALVVGDSVRESLREQARQRIGGVRAAMASGDRFFRADLASRLQPALGPVAPVLHLRGVGSVSGGSARAGLVDVLGVDERFFALRSGGAAPAVPAAGQALVDARLAHQLGLAAGDEFLLRVEKPGTLPRDAVMATVDDVAIALRVVVAGVVSDRQLGRFSLQASQLPPFNVFVALPWLGAQLDLAGRANLLLCGGEGDGGDLAQRAGRQLAAALTLDDLQLSLRDLPGGELAELTSARVFLDDAVAERAAAVVPGALGVMTYFVNAIRHGDREVPYSFATGVGPLGARVAPELAATAALAPAGPDGDLLALNRWTADDLGVAAGDWVELTYYVLDDALHLAERSHTSRVGAVVPLQGAAADPTLMPPFPGLADRKSCRDWAPGIPIDRRRLRDRDVWYWDERRGTPKAFLPLAEARRVWGNRFGSLTAVRGLGAAMASLRGELLRGLDLAELGLFFTDVRGPALATAAPATDFGGLFLGLSFFLLISALLLTSLLFLFGVEQRAGEIGLLLALGFRRRAVRLLFLAEAALLAVAGAAAGTIVGLLYTRAVLLGLGSLWQGAVGAAALSFHARLLTLVGGAAGSVAVALLTLALALRRSFERPAVALLAARQGSEPAPAGPPRFRVAATLAVLAPAGALAIVLATTLGGGPGAEQTAPAFFGAGSLLLIGGLSGCRVLLRRLSAVAGGAVDSLAALAVRNTGRRPGRSLATVALLASGTFLVVAVQANRLQPPADSSRRASGTGGFALFGRSTLPVLRDLGTPDGRAAYGLDAADMDGVAVVPLRVREGDDASCLNLSTPQTPRLLGVRPEQLAERGAFAFARTLAPPSGAVPAQPWQLLAADWGEGVVPAFGDAASVTWTLHKSVGDIVHYRGDGGEDVAVRIVGTLRDSILQGNLIVAGQAFHRHFAGTSGYRAFLIDAPASRAGAVATRLSRALEDLGLELTPTGERLAAFQAVQNTYLLIFQALGGLGLLLGTVGLGLVVLRNVLERRGELAVLRAVGFRAGAVRGLVAREHAVLLLLGLFVGVGAALLGVLPGLLQRDVSVLATGGTVAAIGVSGGLWLWLASAFALRGPLLGALQRE